VAERSDIVQKYVDEAKVAEENGHLDLCWKSLEKAHIVSQPYALLHARVHWLMLKLSLKTLDWSEIRGQTFRLIVAAPGSLLGRYPRGNTGRSNVSAFREMEIPAELTRVLGELSENNL